MLLPWDRLNLIRTQIESLAIEYEWQGTKRRHIKRKECCDLILDWLIDCYLMGDEYVRSAFGYPQTDGVPVDELYDTVYRKVAGKTFAQRVNEYASEGDIESIMRVAETDATRVFTESELKTAHKVGATEKTWNTMLDDKVRDTHSYLQSMTVGIDDEFYTYDGDHAPGPGQFENASNNCGCRCWVTFR